VGGATEKNAKRQKQNAKRQKKNCRAGCWHMDPLFLLAGLLMAESEQDDDDDDEPVQSWQGGVNDPLFSTAGLDRASLNGERATATARPPMEQTAGGRGWAGWESDGGNTGSSYDDMDVAAAAWQDDACAYDDSAAEAHVYTPAACVRRSMDLAAAGGSSNAKGKYSREGTGRRKSHSEYRSEHRERIRVDSLGCPCLSLVDVRVRRDVFAKILAQPVAADA
jgi:hypothetical protein